MFGSNSTTSACQLIDTKPERSMFLELPAEIRLHIYSYLFTGPVQATGITNRGGNILISRGVTSGVGHISIVSNGENWIILSMVKPPGFSLGSTAMLRTCRVVHEEVLDLLHSNILWVIDIKSSAVNSPPDYIRQPLIIAGPSKNTTFMRSISHSHVRQFVIPEKDELLHAAFELHCVLGCLRPDRKSSDVSLHFTGGQLGPDHASCEKYTSILTSLKLGRSPQIEVSYRLLRYHEISEACNTLATRIGGEVNSSSYVHW